MSGDPRTDVTAVDADDDFDPRYDDCEPAMPPECDWGWCRGETVAYRDDLAGTDDSDPLPVCQLHLDHRPDVATSTCQEDGAPWPCEVERHARRTLAEVQAERAHDPTKRYPECALRGDRAPLAGQHTTDEEADRG